MAVAGQNGQILMIGLGAQKAGTTWLYRELGGQPGVAFSRVKELHYWNTIRAPYDTHAREAVFERCGAERRPGLRGLIRERATTGGRAAFALANELRKIYRQDPFDHRRYLEFLGAGGAARLIGEVTPSYALLNAATFREIAACHPDVRFVFVLRDPVRRLWSGVFQRQRPLFRADRLGSDGQARLFHHALEEAGNPDIRMSDYARTFAALDEAGVTDRTFVAFYETLFETDRGGAEVQRLADFVGLGPVSLELTKRSYRSGKSSALPSDLYARGVRALTHVYDDIARRFGDLVPAAWGAAPAQKEAA